MNELRQISIVGASLAGLRAAEGLRRLGFSGRIVLIGEEKSRPYDRPPLSKQILSGKWEPEKAVLHSELAEEDSEIEWCLGERAIGLDPTAKRIQLASGSSCEYDGLVIATGASARQLPLAENWSGVFTLRTLADCLALREAFKKRPKVLVIGAGFIGAEVAATCRGLNLEVTMVEALSAPLERGLGNRLGSLMGDVHRDHGVDLRCGVSLSSLEGSGGHVERATLSDSSILEVDLVVVGIGASPNTSWLAGSGLRIEDGLLCDEKCMAAPQIVAAGDVARWPNRRFAETMRIEHWTHASEQAEAAAQRLLHGDSETPVFEPVPFVWSDQYDRKVQIAGRPRADDQVEICHGSLEERRFIALYGRANRLVGVVGMNRARYVMQYKSMIQAGASYASALKIADT